MMVSRQTPSIRRFCTARMASVLLGAAGLLLISGCASDTEQMGRHAMATAVTANTARQKDVPVSIKVIGTVEAYNTVSVKALIGGELTRVAFTEGQDVRQGDLLLTIDPRPYRAALQAARADSARDAAKAASAEADARRYADLIKKDYVTQQQYDQIKADAQATRATLEADAAAVEKARLDLEYCFIRAPISGRTGNLLVHQGNLIKANDDANPLVTIRQIAPVYVSFSVPEQRLDEVRRYNDLGSLRVTATSPSAPDKDFEGTLTFIDNAVDDATGTILLKATFPNEKHALWPGQFVNVSVLLTTQTNVVVVPTPAVQTGQQGDYVYRIDSDLTVAMQPVTLGERINGETVIEKGVKPGDRVVTDGQLRLTPGAKVEIKTGQENQGVATP